MSRTAVVLLTRDLRVHDHPALASACRDADRVVPLFVLDERILGSRYAAPNRVACLLEALADLRDALRSRGGQLLVRRGDPLTELEAVCREVRADDVHLSADVSAYARDRAAGVARLGDELGFRVHTHPGIVAVPPEELRTSSGGAFRVFTPYWRRWVEHDHRVPVPAPTRVRTPSALRGGRVPGLGELVSGPTAPERPRGGERPAREQLSAWFAGDLEGYDDGRDDLAAAGTSRLSHHLHLGSLSVAEVVARVDRRRRGHEAFLRQVCWRDFNHQLLDARRDLPRRDLRPRGDDWAHDEEALAAWRDGRTGYPVVDAGMRQLRREGFLHNRARLLTASFLTKHLRIDWRVGAWHFMDHLVDGDLANNFGQWQWVAGTGTDPRPNRMFNPVTQAERYDPTGAYVRRYVPELAEVADGLVHAPWRGAGTSLGVAGYPPPIVEHAEARARFLAARGG